jgi:hypothetical protein
MAKRPPTSEAQKEVLRQKQLAYIANDPRWAAHRVKLSEAQRKPDQRKRLSKAQLAYMERDPRWPDHEVRFRQAANEATRLTLSQEEIDQIAALRAKGRNFEYISEILCVSEKVVRRELRARDLPTGRLPPRPKAKRGKGPWRSFDDPHPVLI